MVNLLEINNILRAFYKVSGLRISIHDTEFNEIYAYPQKSSPYCAVILSDLYNKKECIRNDKNAFEKVKATDDIVVYRCAHGMFEMVAPIYHYGILSGFLMGGQVCVDKEKNAPLLIQCIKSVVNEEDKIKEVLQGIKEVPQELFDSYTLLMSVLAKYVTQTNLLFFGNVNQAELIMKYIEQNYASKITLEILAEKFSCSQSTLIKCFRKEYGTTIMSAVMDVRLKKAAEHLKGGRLSVKEIATECGFSEQNYFSKAFSKKYNCSPSEYRKNK